MWHQKLRHYVWKLVYYWRIINRFVEGDLKEVKIDFYEYFLSLHNPDCQISKFHGVYLQQKNNVLNNLGFTNYILYEDFDIGVQRPRMTINSLEKGLTIACNSVNHFVVNHFMSRCRDISMRWRLSGHLTRRWIRTCRRRQSSPRSSLFRLSNVSCLHHALSINLSPRHVAGRTINVIPVNTNRKLFLFIHH
jgi:hypothetical protein